MHQDVNNKPLKIKKKTKKKRLTNKETSRKLLNVIKIALFLETALSGIFLLFAEGKGDCVEECRLTINNGKLKRQCKTPPRKSFARSFLRSREFNNWLEKQ